jgi:alpha-glucoside transport system permease protein
VTATDELADRQAVTAGPAAAALPVPPARRSRRAWGMALLFLAPALIVLGALLVYPIFYTVVRSLYDRSGDEFIGIDNYRQMFRNDRTLHAIRNNAIWVVVAPTLATGIGLILAVLAERVRWQTAFKVAVFMPMAISFLAAGVIFRLVYELDPNRGVANAVVTSVVDAVRPPGNLPGARPSTGLVERDGALVTEGPLTRGDVAFLGLVAIRPDDVPDDARPASTPTAGAREIAGVVWRDFTPGGGTRGAVDEGEMGLPGVRVQLVRNGDVVASTTSGANGRFAFADVESGSFDVRVASSNFREPYGGVEWLGPALVTPSIIAAFLWIWIGFALVVIGAGLAALPRELLEAARVDGANEWQVFRRITGPMLLPVVLVVLVTLMINVLKVFDLVFVIAPGSVQDDANVIALEMWRTSFGGANNQGLGSALALLLFVLVIPAMAFNIKRFRSERR